MFLHEGEQLWLRITQKYHDFTRRHGRPPDTVLLSRRAYEAVKLLADGLNQPYSFTMYNLTIVIATFEGDCMEPHLCLL